jgi:RNA polymerase sigma factor (TIGR02999 family)
MTDRANITELLAACDRGDGSSVRVLMSAMYDQLRILAQSHLQHERTDHTLQPTALVHEAFLKLLGPQAQPGEPPVFVGRAHLFAAAGAAMRRILVDHARGKARLKRGGPRGERQRIALTDVAHTGQLEDEDLLALDEALAALAMEDARAAQLVELRFFAGLSLEEVARVLDVNERTVRRQWLFAKAHLLRSMGGSASPRGEVSQ